MKRENKKIFSRSILFFQEEQFKMVWDKKFDKIFLAGNELTA